MDAQRRLDALMSIANPYEGERLRLVSTSCPVRPSHLEERRAWFRLTERGILLCRPSALSIMFVIRNQNPRDDPIEVDCSARSSPRSHSQRLRRSERWPSSSAPMLRRRYAGRRFQSIATGLHSDEGAFRIINFQDAVAEIARSHSDDQGDQCDVAHEVDIDIQDRPLDP
jgi:hypothetical protein